MKKTILTILFLSSCLISFAGNENYLWPIKGAKAGDGIISQPQDYIDNELNFGNIFIEAPEGTIVLSPVDGVIENFGIGYLSSLTHASSIHGSGSFDSQLEKQKSRDIPMAQFTYICGSIGIKSGKYMIWISGLTGSEVFKTGQKIKRGEPIGRVGYSYHKIAKPSIEISMSKYTLPVDPMTPFGIETTYIAPVKMKPIKSLTKEQVKEDFNVYIESLKELFPGLYDVLSEEELESFIAKIVAEIDSFEGDLKFDDFNSIFKKTLRTIHDSHIYSRGYFWKDKEEMMKYQPAIIFGFIQDTLICNVASEGYEKYLKRKIKSVNGISADSIKIALSSLIDTFDAKVEEYTEVQMGLFKMGALFSPLYTFDMTVEFEDGETVKFKGIPAKKVKYPAIKYQFNNGYVAGNKKYDFKILNDSVAYLDISTFSLNDVELEEIASYIDSAATIKNLIIDVRDNSGGDVEATSKLFSYFAADSVKLNGYEKVNSNGGLKMLKYSTNHSESSAPFKNYKPKEGKTKYYSMDNAYVRTILKPDSLVNFKNRIYVLANENSISAATIFPALVVRTNRGVVVGRETRSAYHFLNALKFAHMQLPNSKYAVTIPLVKIVFDDVVNERVPYGRGVIPDYHVPFTWDEIFTEDSDMILKRALELIEDGEYITGNPFADLEEDGKSGFSLSLKIGVVLLGVFVLFLFLRKRRKKTL